MPRGEKVLHQASLDALLFGNQRLCLFNRAVHRRKYLGNFGLFEIGVGKADFNSLELLFIECRTFDGLVDAL